MQPVLQPCITAFLPQGFKFRSRDWRVLIMLGFINETRMKAGRLSRKEGKLPPCNISWLLKLFFCLLVLTQYEWPDNTCALLPFFSSQESRSNIFCRNVLFGLENRVKGTGWCHHHQTQNDSRVNRSWLTLRNKTMAWDCYPMKQKSDVVSPPFVDSFVLSNDCWLSFGPDSSVLFQDPCSISGVLKGWKNPLTDLHEGIYNLIPPVTSHHSSLSSHHEWFTPSHPYSWTYQVRSMCLWCRYSSCLCYSSKTMELHSSIGRTEGSSSRP